jgi:hypothetical protein
MSETLVSELKQFDQFGRTEAERTIVLSPLDAELINREVESRNHQTYDGAISFVLSIGFAKLAYDQVQKDKRDATTELKRVNHMHSKLIKQNPQLLIDATYQANHQKELDRLDKIING